MKALRPLPAYLKARSGSSFESRVERDRKDADARKKKSRVLKDLHALKLSDGKSYEKREDAEADLMKLWAKNPKDAGGSNDLAVALAWVEQWEEAIKVIGAAIAAGKDDDEKQRAEANKKHIKSAREAARA